jgi:hypothetical protein
MLKWVIWIFVALLALGIIGLMIVTPTTTKGPIGVLIQG